MTEKHLTDQKFDDFNLADTLKKGVADAGFSFCTPIQASALPIALEGRDVAGQAQTGTGKTIAFLLACCNYLLTTPLPEDKKKSKKTATPRALILAPTRELAIQIYKDAETLAQHTGLTLGLIYGGTGYDEQKQILAKGVDILIGTPGRLIDFYKQDLFSLQFIQVAVLDEADRMFDLGFIKDIRFLLRRMPKPENRLNMLFSATLSFRVMELAYEHMNDPEEIKINADVRIANQIEEHSYYPSDDEKPKLLVNLLNHDNPERVLVFINTRSGVEYVANLLTANNISTAALSGDVQQSKREKLLEGFKTGKYKVLVATDVAARGLHIPEVSHVYNYDLPQDADDYVHRIGRTARAGNSGKAISFLCERYSWSILDIESYIGHSIPKKSIEPWMIEDVEVSSKRPRERKSTPLRKPEPQKAEPKKRTKSGKNPSLNHKQSEQKTEGTVALDIIEPGKPEPQKAESKAEPQKPVPLEPVPLVNRFSRRFGEVPMIG